MENVFMFRAINPHSEEDIKKYLDIHDQLNAFLNKKVKPLSEEQIKWLRIRMGATELLPEHQQEGEYALGLQKVADEYCFVCEKDGEIVGHIFVNTYNVIDGERTNDNTGNISEIFVKPEFRNKGVSFKLLQMGVNKLLESGCKKAICNVQEDNKNRFLHFAMADGNIVRTDKCKRKDGSVTTDYTLLIDLNKLNKLTERQLAEKAIKYKREWKSKQNILKI